MHRCVCVDEQAVCVQGVFLIGFFNVLQRPRKTQLTVGPGRLFPAGPAPPSAVYSDRRQGGIFAQDRSLFRLTIGLNLLFSPK